MCNTPGTVEAKGLACRGANSARVLTTATGDMMVAATQRAKAPVTNASMERPDFEATDDDEEEGEGEAAAPSSGAAVLPRRYSAPGTGSAGGGGGGDASSAVLMALMDAK